MKKKALIVTTVASTIEQFLIPNIKILREMNFEIHVISNFQYIENSTEQAINEFKEKLENNNIIIYDIQMNRNPIHKNNLLAYKKIKNIIDDGNYSIIHCHTPVGGALTRLAAKSSRKSGTKVVYTAHGFHFFKGAPVRNWILFYPLERLLSYYTDGLITINKEDFKRAKNFHANKVFYISGVGIDLKKFDELDHNKENMRNQLRIPFDAKVVLSIGELNSNKNHEVIIKAISKLQDPNVYYLICGKGIKYKYLMKLIISYGLENNVKLLGYRNDVPEICTASDVFAFPSKEGLGLAALEAMATGLPIVTSNIHGILDYSINGVTGFNYKPDDINGFSKAIYELTNNAKLVSIISEKNREVVKSFSIDKVNINLCQIYIDILDGE